MDRLKKRKLTDRAAQWVIILGGAATVFVILALFLFIFIEVYPLLKGAQVLDKKVLPLETHSEIVFTGLDEYQEIAYTLDRKGNMEFISLMGGKVLRKYDVQNLHGSVITSVDKTDEMLVLGTDDGRMLKVSVNFSAVFENGKRAIVPEISEADVVVIDDKKRAISLLASKSDNSTTVTAALTRDGRLILKSTEIRKTLFGPAEKKETWKDITDLVKKINRFSAGEHYIKLAAHNNRKENQDQVVQITSLALDLFMENLYIGTSQGEVFHINIVKRDNPFLIEKIKMTEGSITALGFLLGDISLVVGDSLGGVSVWMKVRNNSSPTGWVLTKVHNLESHNAGILSIIPSRRDKGFVTAASDGTVYLHHATSEQTLLRLKSISVPAVLAFAPKADGILVADTGNNLIQWVISNPHPEVTMKTLFGRVWYEGYEKPEFIWQSTGGTDDFEPKLSLVPLIFGTIKGTVYALIFAVPIGILAALYTSQFLHNSLKLIKPVIEILAALPSVILGFLAGLWLAPLLEKIFPAMVIMPVFIVLAITVALLAWKTLPVFKKSKFQYGIEALFLIPFIIGAVYISIPLGNIFEEYMLGGDYRQWLLQFLGLQYDQRNAVVVGFAMGFAVIPLIFTISEDAMSNVPKSLISASLALGATPWQTATRIVLPTASPAIFSAVMIGFGRAVGETMIVLMATGNTPIMDWNLFSGFRALAANIAVEIPEAPVGGTLYRVLFLAALLLFVTTFIVNTVAELIRQRMKQKYSKL